MVHSSDCKLDKNLSGKTMVMNVINKDMVYSLLNSPASGLYPLLGLSSPHWSSIHKHPQEMSHHDL